MNKTLKNKIDRFLKDRRHSDGGCADVTNDDHPVPTRERIPVLSHALFQREGGLNGSTNITWGGRAGGPGSGK